MRTVVGEYVCAKSKLIEAVLQEIYKEIRVWRTRVIYVGFAQKSRVFGMNLTREMLYLCSVAWVFE